MTQRSAYNAKRDIKWPHSNASLVENRYIFLHVKVKVNESAEQDKGKEKRNKIEET